MEVTDAISKALYSVPTKNQLEFAKEFYNLANQGVIRSEKSPEFRRLCQKYNIHRPQKK